jgi:protein ImuB
VALIASTPPRSLKEIERARHTERIIGILHQWGIHTIGQLAKLEPDALAARLGTRAVELWERANGKATRVLKLVAPPESFVESFEWENEIETSEPLLFMLRRFLQQLATRLNAIYLVANELRLRITFSDKSHYERLFEIPQPTNNEEVLFRMLHTHLENFTSKHPIAALELEAHPSKPIRQQFGLFETALRDPAQLHETLARLVGLLGAERVGRPVLEETHRPDAFRIEPFRWEFQEHERNRGATENFVIPSEVEGSRNESLTFPQRNPSTPLRSGREDNAKLRIPLRRFRKRANATVLLENNRPAHVRAKEIEGLSAANDGPFPLSGNWWDERAWSRVEWDVELDHGTVARCHCDEDGWAVDGIYD